MFFKPKQELNQMTDADLDRRKDKFDTVKQLGEAMVKGCVVGGVLFGGLALSLNAAKFMVTVAFFTGAAVPAVAGIAAIIVGCVALDQVEKVQNSRPRATPAKKQPKADVAPVAATPALANVPDLGEDFHAGVKDEVTTMKPLKFKTRPQSPSVM